MVQNSKLSLNIDLNNILKLVNYCLQLTLFMFYVLNITDAYNCLLNYKKLCILLIEYTDFPKVHKKITDSYTCIYNNVRCMNMFYQLLVVYSSLYSGPTKIKNTPLDII